MKKILIILMVLIYINANSQIVEKVGVSIGATYTTLDWNYKTAGDGFSLDFNYITGVNGNILMEFNGSKHLNFITSLGYIEKGGKSNIITQGFHGTWEPIDTIQEIIKYNYLSFSFGGKIKYPFEKLVFFATIKPRIDYMISSIEHDLTLGNIGKSINKVNYGLIYGLGISYDISSNISLMVIANNNLNIKRINNTDYKPGEFGLEINDKTFIFNFGVAYRIGEKLNTTMAQTPYSLLEAREFSRTVNYVKYVINY